MGSFHDDFRRSLKVLEILLQPDSSEKNLLNKELGKLFFVVLPIIFCEEQIAFPVALRAIPEIEWHEMLPQRDETGWCYGVNPNIHNASSVKENPLNGQISLDTGFLNAEQISLMLTHLPLDITCEYFANQLGHLCNGINKY